MNLDFALVNRSLLNINMEPLKDDIRGGDSKEWETARAYYLQTMLETLAQAEWAGAKRRRELAPARFNPKKNAGFAHAYALPADCAKPCELDGQAYFKVESGFLFTDIRPARLLYVSDGKFVPDQEIIDAGDSRRGPTPDYVSGGDASRNRRLEWGDGAVSAGGASTARVTAGGKPRAPLPPPEDDYPEYREPRLEPNFYYYWECLLSAKYAARLTDQPGLADAWLAKAMAIGKAAQAASLELAAGRKTAAPTWQEELGLS